MNNTNYYTFQKSRNGETVPAIINQDGNAQPLHSMIDPIREAQRLVSTIGKTDFVIFLGLGGGFAPQSALELTDSNIVIIDFNKDGIAELFANRDYSKLLNNGRVSILIDSSEEEIKSFVIENFIPALCGGIKTFPLRTRTEHDKSKFEKAAAVIQQAIETVSGDYSVQSHFGLRWFSNIIRNIKNMQTESFFAEKKENPIQEAAIVAAGPSLDTQISSLAEFKSHNGFIICADTALGVLLHNNIVMDAVVSIDCQHISYYHFMGVNQRGKKIPLILDIASPPLLCGLSSFTPVFFSGGHPLTRYLCAHWRYFPQLDTSGGNVTYAALSLAQALGAKHITLFGADFSYIRSQTYARGTYIYPYFNRKQNRLSPEEAQLSAFLYRAPFLPNEDGQKKNYYETASLRFYRKKLEEKASMMNAEIKSEHGFGAPINLSHTRKNSNVQRADYKENKSTINGTAFLEQYRNDIASLPKANENGNYLKRLNEKDSQIFTTILPAAAALKHRDTNNKTTAELIESTKYHCLKQIDKILGTY
ncbi:6-hydroxymethylpterin diphosphokinase MptE-like protein [Treponema sp. R80B11-R83G3]